MKRVSRSFALSTIQDGVSYSIVWTNMNGTITTIACDSDGKGKTVPEGYGNIPWVTATLYKMDGDTSLVPCEAKTVVVKAYDIHGEVAETLPTKGNSSFFSIEKDYSQQSSHAKYEVEFLNANNETLAKSAICRTLDGTNGIDGIDGDDGINTPSYSVEQYAWSNQSSTGSVTEHPSDVTEDDFLNTIPPQNGKAYLWKKVTQYNLIVGSKPAQYLAATPMYYRLTGERGTSISVKGQAVCVIIGKYENVSDLPLSGVSEGDYAFVFGVEDDLYLYKYERNGNSYSWQKQDFVFKNNNIVILKSDANIYKFSIDDIMRDQYPQADGSAYTNLLDGCLWQWSLEAMTWLNLGQFKGEHGNDGKTFYTHIAWATDVYMSGGLLSVEGFTTQKNYNDNTLVWMGVLVDENEGQDQQRATLYKWSYIKGEKGNEGSRGRIGRFYYYGGVFDPSDSTTKFLVNDSEVPFFESHLTANSYYVFNSLESHPNSEVTMSQMWGESEYSFNNTPWEAIYNDFKYIITEAIFGKYAHFGSFIINGDWMISQQGQNNSPNPQTPSYLDFTPLENGTFDNKRFVPAFAINAKTGETWIGNAHVNGEINATSGTFNGRIVSSSGSIGGFNISSNSLENNEAIDGSKIQLKSTNSLASIGNVKMPNDINDVLFGARIASEFTANEEDSLNVAVKARATGSGGARNFALHGFGHVVTQGMAVGYKLNVMNITSSYKYIDIKEGNIVLISGGNNRIAYLPTLSNVRNELKIPKTEPFAVKLTLLIASDDMHIFGYQSGATYQSDNYPPYQRDNYFTNHPNHDVSKGQVYTYMLVWDGTDDPQHYNAWLVGYGDRGY